MRSGNDGGSMVPIKRPLVDIKDSADRFVSEVKKNAKDFSNDQRRAGTLKFESMRGLYGGVDQFTNTEGLP